MAQWGKQDNAANSVLWAVASYKTVNTANRDLLFGNTTPDAFVTDQTVGQYGADTTETAVETRITHAGWVLRREGTGGRAGRVTFETLVAGSSITGDAEDTVLKDVKINFTGSGPANIAVAAPAPATFAVTTGSTPAGATITYQWQANTGSGFTNLTNGAVYSNTATSTLSIADSTGLNGVQYRVLALSAGANTITSKAATLTVN